MLLAHLDKQVKTSGANGNMSHTHPDNVQDVLVQMLTAKM